MGEGKKEKKFDAVISNTLRELIKFLNDNDINKEDIISIQKSKEGEWSAIFYN